MNSSFPNRWSFSYLKFTKYVTNIIAEPKYKYGQQEQVTVRNHNRVYLSNNQYKGHAYSWAINSILFYFIYYVLFYFILFYLKTFEFNFRGDRGKLVHFAHARFHNTREMFRIQQEAF